MHILQCRTKVGQAFVAREESSLQLDVDDAGDGHAVHLADGLDHVFARYGDERLQADRASEQVGFRLSDGGHFVYQRGRSHHLGGADGAAATETDGQDRDHLGLHAGGVLVSGQAVDAPVHILAKVVDDGGDATDFDQLLELRHGQGSEGESSDEGEGEFLAIHISILRRAGFIKRNGL